MLLYPEGYHFYLPNSSWLTKRRRIKKSTDPTHLKRVYMYEIIPSPRDVEKTSEHHIDHIQNCNLQADKLFTKQSKEKNKNH